MRIKEIVNLSPRDEDTTKFSINFNSTFQQVVMPDDSILRVVENNEIIDLGVFKGNNIIAYVGLHKEENYYQVIMTSSLREYRGQGYIRYCLEYAIHNFGPIISDWQQTPEARAVWTALIKRPNTVEYYYYNLNDRSKERIKWDDTHNKPTPDPWEDDSADIVILAAKKSLSEQTIARMQARKDLNKKYGYRDPWLGEGFTEFNP